MENELELKWRRIQQAMRQEEADGCLLTMNMNLYYVSGQVFNGYFYLPAEGRPYWFVKRLTVPDKSGTCYPETGTNAGTFSRPESGNAPQATS